MSVHGLESVPRYRELLDRLLGEELDFIPNGFILEQDDEELAYLKREIRWSTQPQVVAAVAAQNGFWQIRNPQGSNRIVTVARVFVLCGATRTFSYALTTTVRGASGAFAAIPTDTRWNDPIIPAGALAARDAPLETTSGTTAASVVMTQTSVILMIRPEPTGLSSCTNDACPAVGPAVSTCPHHISSRLRNASSSSSCSRMKPWGMKSSSSPSSRSRSSRYRGTDSSPWTLTAQIGSTFT